MEQKKNLHRALRQITENNKAISTKLKMSSLDLMTESYITFYQSVIQRATVIYSNDHLQKSSSSTVTTSSYNIRE